MNSPSENPQSNSVHTPALRSQGKDAIRRANLTAALGSVRLAGHLSRSELIQTLRLSRTTVFELVGQLVELGLVSEGEFATSNRVGRPSFVVSPAEKVGAYAVNPESDALSVGVVNFRGELIARKRLATPQPLSPEKTAIKAGALLAELAAKLPAGFTSAGVGVALPGQVQRDTGMVRLAPRLNWRDVHFAQLLAQETDLPVRIDNNARLVTLAEHRYGQGRGYSDFTYIFGGAGGIGGASVADNRIIGGRHGYAGEMGHVRLSQGGRSDFGGISGTLEALVQRDDLLTLFGRDSPSDDELHHLIHGADDGLLRSLAQEQLQVLGVFVGNVANIFDPEMVILGGFLGSLYARYPDTLQQAMTQVALPAIAEQLQIAVSVDNSTMALIGAAELIFDEITADPTGFTIR